MFPSEPSGAHRPGSAEWWEERTRREQRRRARRGGLSLDRILKAALGIVDTRGLDALTMRDVADELGTGVASLYRHVATKTELLVELIDAVLGEIVLPESGVGWRAGSGELARELRQAFRGRRAQLLAQAPGRLLGPSAVRLKQEAFGRLLGHGFAPGAAARLYFAVTHFVFGWVLFEDTIARSPDRPPPTVSAGFGTPEPPGAPPGLPGVLPTPDESFEFALRALLDGLALRAEELGFPSPGPV